MGGNIFDAAEPIRKTRIDGFVDRFYENVLRHVGVTRAEPMGMTGLKPVSNDVDLAVDFAFSGNTPEGRKRDKLELARRCAFHVGEDNVKVRGQLVHVLYEENVQVDLAPCDRPRNLAWLQRGLYRNLLMSLVAKKRSEELTKRTGVDHKITVGCPGGTQIKYDGEVVIKRIDVPHVIIRELGFRNYSESHLDTFEKMVYIMSEDAGMSGWLNDFADYTKQFADRDDYQDALDVIENTLKKKVSFV